MTQAGSQRSIAVTSGHPEQEVGCAVCGLNHPFDLPDELVTAALHGNVVIFAGAGVSTESRSVFGGTFAEVIAAELKLDPSAMSFPQVTTAYEIKFGRPLLLQQIKERLDYARAFPDLLHMATRFHRELATAYFLDQVITTNWDTYFEEFAAATPIVIPEDYAFWELEGRKVFKLHGSITNLGTVVATERDYDRCYRRLRDGAIGGSFRHILATKRLVFVGYSFGDSDLNRILRFLRRELSSVLPRSYLIAPHGYEGSDFPSSRVIETDGTYFIQKLKEAAVERHALRPDSAFDQAAYLGRRISTAHERVLSSVKVRQSPSVVHTLAYQDGVPTRPRSDFRAPFVGRVFASAQHAPQSPDV